ISNHPMLILFLIQAIFVLLSMFGIHPIATVGILTGITTPLLEVMNPVSIALVLITGSVATFTVGTYGLLVTLTSMSTKQNPFRITIRNMPFCNRHGSSRYPCSVSIIIRFLGQRTSVPFFVGCQICHIIL